jgi:hypothetical protein
LRGMGSGARRVLQRVSNMTPAGYVAKRLSKRPDWLNVANVEDVYSVSSCVSEDFGDYIANWKHNGYWFFDSPEIIKNVTKENSIQLEGTSLFYYEAYEMEFDSEGWEPRSPETSFPTNVVLPLRKRLEGFDAVSFSAGTNPECSPLSCNSMAAKPTRIPIVCSSLLRRLRAVSTMGHLRTVSSARTEYFRSIR